MIKDINEILSKNVVRALVQRICGNDIDIIKRQTCFVVRKKHEDERQVQRIIILAPKGYTANTPNQMNSHDEAEYATIEVKGAIRAEGKSFSILKNCLFVASSYEKGKTSSLNKPYMEYDLETTFGISKEFYSAGEPPFAVVKSDGFGFYHNLVNSTDEWLVLVLNKKMRPQKSVDLVPHFADLSEKEADVLGRLYEAVVEYGDEVFKRAESLVDEVCQLQTERILPALGEMLYTFDTGKHEACTAFAMILKLSKTEPEKVIAYLNGALESKAIPVYYTRQLLQKIERDKQKATGIIA